MASDNESVVQGRPPDSPALSHRKHKFNHWSYPSDNINNNLLLVENDDNRKLSSFTDKLFCIKKSLDEDTLKCISASKICDNNPSGSSVKDRNRNSFHQDVEEALNSLLWQPYEYQNNNLAPSLSCSSCSSTFSDLDESPNKGPLHSSQEDRDLNVCTEMVNNLKPPAHQYRYKNRSRDTLSCYAASRLNSQASLLEYIDGTGVTCPGDSDCDVFNKNSDMQLEVSPSNTSVTPNNIINIPTGNDGLIRNQQNGTIRNVLQPVNLSSANVVGLPENPRRTSVPSNQIRAPTGNNNIVFPNHPRNVSEPSTMSITNQFRFNNQSNVVPVVPQRNSLEQQNKNLITHFRSASVPKTMTDTTFVNHQRINSADNRNNQQKVTPLNVSNVNVNFYRAVPVNVVSAVPTIQCLNTLNNDEGNSVSNVHIMPLGNTQTPFSSAAVTGTTQVTVHNTQTPTHSVNVVQNTIRNPCNNSTPRTFTSTEAQTDEISVCPPPSTEVAPSTREQKRKERRERRHQRRVNNTNHRHAVDSGTQVGIIQQNDRLPDLLNSHMPPPYSPIPNTVPSPNVVMPNPVPMIVPSPVLQTVVPNNVIPSGLVAFPPPQVVGGQVPLVQSGPGIAVQVPTPSGFRFPFPPGGFRRGRFSDEPPKGCCGLLAWKPGSLRWFIAVIALVAVCCVLVGTALGAMRPAGRDHLTVSLLMIGVGIVLVTVSGVAWRLTSHDSSTCRSMLGLGSTESVDVCTRRFVPRLPPSYGRPHHPYAAMMYPEFQYRPPPPSYQASMQEYRLRLLLLDRGNTPQIQAGLQNAVSPPPTYRSHVGSLLRAPLTSRRGDMAQSEYSCPPSYRSQTSTNRPGTLQNSVLHSREQSLSESNNGECGVNVVNILGSTEEDMVLDNMTLDSLKMEPESDLNPLKLLLKGSSSDLEGSKDGNLVTIVQTSDRSPVIVTVSGSSQIEGRHVHMTEISPEMEILAHL